MKRRRIGKGSSRSSGSSRAAAPPSYYRDMGEAIGQFLPHHGLPLLTQDGRVRWTARLLAILGIFMSWGEGRRLKDRFEKARAALVGIYPTRRRPGQTHEGFAKALLRHGAEVLAMLMDYWRGRVREVAGACWEVCGWALFGVDGSKFDCPRTEANEKGLGVTGKNNSGPQQLLTCLFHIGSGILWGWRRGGIQGSSERGQLLEMIDLLPQRALLLADAGFTGYDLLKAIMRQGSHFLIRVGANVQLLTRLGYAVQEHRQTVYLWPLEKQGRGKRKEMPRTLRSVQEPLVLRLIRLRDAQGRPVCLLTDVGTERLSDAVAARLYKLRWGIEVMWRDLKQTMSHHKTLSGTPDRAGAELDWAMAGLGMLQLLSVQRMVASGQLPHRYSPARSLRAVRRAMSGRRRRRRSLTQELTAAVKDQYHRCGPKAARHYPHKRPQHPPGEPVARMAFAIEIRLAQRIREQPPPKSAAA